jgi:hypothetical protein
MFQETLAFNIYVYIYIYILSLRAYFLLWGKQVSMISTLVVFSYLFVFCLIRDWCLIP